MAGHKRKISALDPHLEIKVSVKKRRTESDYDDLLANMPQYPESPLNHLYGNCMSIPDSGLSDPPRDSTEDVAQSTASSPEEQETQELPDPRQNEDICHLIDPVILKSSIEMWQPPGSSRGKQINQPTQTQNDQKSRGIQRAQEIIDTQHNPETSSQPFVEFEVSSPKPSLPDEHFAQAPTQGIQDLGCIQQDQSEALNLALS
jgi:hypothetical protein